MRVLSSMELPILSEEGREIPYENRKNWERLWIIDPLDGTKEFIKHNDEFTVNIALVEYGMPALGVVYAPVKKALYFAAKTIGACKNENPGQLDWLKQDSDESNAGADFNRLIENSIQLPVERSQRRPSSSWEAAPMPIRNSRSLSRKNGGSMVISNSSPPAVR